VSVVISAVLIIDINMEIFGQ